MEGKKVEELVEFGVGKKMEKMGCDGRPRAWAAVFSLAVLAVNEGGEEKKQEREDGDVNTCISVSYTHLTLPTIYSV